VQMEANLYAWIMDQRSKGFSVSYCQIFAKAKEMASALDIVKFKASCHWLQNFLKRYKLRVRSLGESDSECIKKSFIKTKIIDADYSPLEGFGESVDCEDIENSVIDISQYNQDSFGDLESSFVDLESDL
jgi:hypothetical protein